VQDGEEAESHRRPPFRGASSPPFYAPGRRTATRPVDHPEHGAGEELARRFFQAVGEGDVEGRVGMHATDVVAYADGGGKATAFPRPVHGREKVSRAQPPAARVSVRGIRPAKMNGQPGALFLDPDGVPVVAVSLDIAEVSCRRCAQ
jgi:RNA polymerase sigma-70 factor, ECF subfamily